MEDDQHETPDVRNNNNNNDSKRSVTFVDGNGSTTSDFVRLETEQQSHRSRRRPLSPLMAPPIILSSIVCQLTTEPEDAKVRTNNVSAFVTLLKALFGVSLLSSPRVLGETGLVLGTIVYSCILLACVGSCWCLLQARAQIVRMAEDAAAAQEEEEQVMSSYCPPPSNNNSNNDAHANEDPSMPPRPSLLDARSVSSVSSSTSSSSINAITYGDLGRTLLGTRPSTVINFLIVSLHILFGAGLIATSMHQVAIVLGWEDDYATSSDSAAAATTDDDNNDDGVYATDEQGVFLYGRVILALILFPIISLVLQFRNISDLFYVCLAGLVIFVVGCIGTMVPTSTAFGDMEGDGSTSQTTAQMLWNVPDDAFAWKWSGIPNFVASTLCAMEGINLALPIANHYLAHAPMVVAEDGTSHAAATMRSPIPVVTAAVSFFGVISLIVAYFGFLSGLGGGSSDDARNEEDGDDGEETTQECAAVAHCLDSDILEVVHRLSLAVSLILTLPIILYPSLELLERWAEERYKQLKTGKTSSNRVLVKDSWSGYVWGTPSDSQRLRLNVEEKLFGRDPYFPGLHRHWRFRLSHAAAVCLFAIVDRRWERWLVLYKGTGLSIACFLLPVILFVRAYSLGAVLQQPLLVAALTGLMALGLINLVLVILSVFTEHNFLPDEIHEHPMHHHHSADESGDGDM